MSKKPKVDPHSPFAQLEKLKQAMEDEKKSKGAPPAGKGGGKSVGKDGGTRTGRPGRFDQGGGPRSGDAAGGSLRGSAGSSPGSSASGEGESDGYEFHRLLAGVRPLGERGARRVPASKVADAPGPGPTREEQRAQAEARTRAEEYAVHAQLRALVEGGASRFEVVDDGRHVEGRRVDVPPATLRALRRGLVPIDVRMDLHGLRESAAHEALAAFLRDQRVRGERCALVVHGKGAHSPGGIGVLRGEIAAWLSQGKASEHVAAFATATADDGGEGAVYVLLRR